MKRLKVLFVLIFAIVLNLSLNVFAAGDVESTYDYFTEYIASFHSDIKVNADSSMEVTETITVNSLGLEIKRGIYRDFPTTYYDNLKNKYKVGFEVIEVQRDGQNEPYTIEPIMNGKRIRIGNAKIYLPDGRHTYIIKYRTNRQIGYFEDHDELYWNVTGNDWAFPIKEASATVKLPYGANEDDIKLDGYTGKKGSTAKNFESSIDEYGNINFYALESFKEGAGITIVVGWPKGFVAQPTGSEKLQNFIKDNLNLGLSLLFLIIIFLYYLFVWNLKGRDPKKGTIIPIYESPNGLSPAEIRYIKKMGFDKKAFSSAIINLAVKGYLTISKDEDDKYILKPSNNHKGEPTAEEDYIYRSLIEGKKEVRLTNDMHEEIKDAMHVCEISLKDKFKNNYFDNNIKYFIYGLVLSGLYVLFAFYMLGLSIGSEQLLSAASIGIIYAFILVKAGTTLINSIKTIFSGDGILTSVSSILVGVFSAAILVVIVIVTFGAMSEYISVAWFVVFSMIFAINIIFYYLLKAYSVFGRKVLDSIEGFKMFLGVAEKDRLNYMFPINKTPELFEKYLPYALALDVEQEWTDQFADVFANMSNSQENYTPSWYYSSADGYTGINDFTSSFSDSFTSAIATSSTPPPSSSSGFGGGGFSGGGGGGGGGGGW